MKCILLCAGNSSRYPGMPPKYLLPVDSGTIMGRAAVTGLPRTLWNIVLQQNHIEKHDAVEKIKEHWGEPFRWCSLPSLTRGPAESTYQALHKLRIDSAESIFVKDCDSGFQLDDWPFSNVLCVSHARGATGLSTDKCHVRTDVGGRVVEIAEKRAVSDWIATGGYAFRTAGHFMKAFESVAQGCNTEIFLSHVIAQLLECGEVFETRQVTHYGDWGTLEKWNAPQIYHQKGLV